MRILIDVDGVLADFHQHTLDLLVEKWGSYYNVAEFPTWDIFETIGRTHQAEIEAYWRTPGWCANIPVYQGAQAAVSHIRDMGHEVYFVTAQMTHSPYWMWERVEWLKRNFKADDSHVIFTLSKFLVVGDMLIDDKYSNVEGWQKSHPDKLGILWDQPTNRGATLIPGMRRCSSWTEIHRLIESVRSDRQ